MKKWINKSTFIWGVVIVWLLAAAIPSIDNTKTAGMSQTVGAKKSTPTQIPTPTPCSNGVNGFVQAYQGSCATPTPTPRYNCEQVPDPDTAPSNQIREYMEQCRATPTATPIPQYNETQQQTYYYEDPTATPYPVQQSQNVSCYTSGDYTYCSDGSSSMQSGNTSFVHGGSDENSGSCTTIGNYVHCSDGSSATNIGNSTFIHNSDGTSSNCTTIGNIRTCH